MKDIFFLVILFFSYISIANATIKVAVIDSGLDLNDTRLNSHLCLKGHKDFTETGLKDVNGHGTFIVGLIEKYAQNSDYCLMIYKYYDSNQPGSLNLNHEIQAIYQAIDDGAQIVNISGGGPTFNEFEALAIKYHPKVTFVVAAGNNSQNLDIPGNEFYPASYFYPNEIVVGAINKYGNSIPSSNYGTKVEIKELGRTESYLPNNKIGYMEGTSMSTAIHTGKLIRELNGTK